MATDNGADTMRISELSDLFHDCDHRRVTYDIREPQVRQAYELSMEIYLEPMYS